MDLEGMEKSGRTESERREELKQKLAEFVERDDMRGLVEFVEQIAHFDGLTGVLNRIGFAAEAEPLFRRIAKLDGGRDRRTGEYATFHVLFLDLDKFKSINDTYGHAVGDEALKRTAAILRETLRDEDVVGRWGGEEFVVVFTSSSEEAAGADRDRRVVAEKVRQAIAETIFESKGTRIPLTASIGAAQLQPGEASLEEVIKRADQAMYRAKEQGRNQVVLAEEVL